MNVLGLDIGGANLKVADADGRVRSREFPIWRRKHDLVSTLVDITAEFSTPAMVALTMTGELADCFQTKTEGIQFIMESVSSAFPGIPLRVWMTSGEFGDQRDAMELPELVAAGNWHALATWVARAVPVGPALLIDMGSTTTDLIPIRDGLPEPTGRTDLDRLQSGELLYVGACRTPLCAILRSVEIAGQDCPVAAEHFAATADALVVRGILPENRSSADTADGRPLLRRFCLNRLAHMVCCDSTELPNSEIERIAETAVQILARTLHDAINSALDRLNGATPDPPVSEMPREKVTVILCGSGSGVVRKLTDVTNHHLVREVMDLSEAKGWQITTCACAFALAQLARERCRTDVLKTEHFHGLSQKNGKFETQRPVNSLD